MVNYFAQKKIEMSFFTFNFEWGNQRTEILETEIGFATFFSFFFFFKKEN